MTKWGIVPPLDPFFVPAVLWNRAYEKQAEDSGVAEDLTLVLERKPGDVSRLDLRILPEALGEVPRTYRYVERHLKFLLWQQGGARVMMSGRPDLLRLLRMTYAPGGERVFDAEFLGGRIYRQPLSFEIRNRSELPQVQTLGRRLGRNLDGFRIGFDLGGSDRKCAALVDGEVVFSEEVRWDPYFEKSPDYHYRGIQDSLKKAAAHLPRVDAIGGSAAGVYVDNEVCAASLFRGVPADLFESEVRPMFKRLQAEWNHIPFEIINDGEVTALAGAMSLRDDAVLGVSLGTSQAGGYVTPGGSLTNWLNELAFVPVDYAPAAPADEWSGDRGCGVQYFSQQAVGRLARRAEIEFPADLALPEQLATVQDLASRGDRRAEDVFRTIGVYLGYTAARYAEVYDYRHLLLLGRVMSGAGGGLILEEAGRVLSHEFPVLHEKIRLVTPDEKQKRHGQAIAAASLPEIGKKNP